jgi:hypothetical protein
MNNKYQVLSIILIILLIILGVFINIREEKAVDDSKIPERVEMSRGFQRWITNLKNKGVDKNADEFRMIEENEIYNSMWMKVYSMDDQDKKELYDKTMNSVKDLKKIAFSPSEREFLDYRNEIRDGYLPEEVRFFGQKEDKIIDSRIVSCLKEANCYFDRGYFIDNDVLVITEFSMSRGKDKVIPSKCSIDSVCTYTIKLHLADLVRNSRTVYESEPFEVNLSVLIPEL